ESLERTVHARGHVRARSHRIVDRQAGDHGRVGGAGAWHRRIAGRRPRRDRRAPPRSWTSSASALIPAANDHSREGSGTEITAKSLARTWVFVPVRRAAQLSSDSDTALQLIAYGPLITCCAGRLISYTCRPLEHGTSGGPTAPAPVHCGSSRIGTTALPLRVESAMKP